MVRLIRFGGSYLRSLWACSFNTVNVVIYKKACGCRTTRLLLGYRELSHRSHQKPSSRSRRSLLSSLSCFVPSDPRQLHQPCRRININKTIVDDSPDHSKMPTGHRRHVVSFLCAGGKVVRALGCPQRSLSGIGALCPTHLGRAQILHLRHSISSRSKWENSRSILHYKLYWNLWVVNVLAATVMPFLLPSRENRLQGFSLHEIDF